MWRILMNRKWMWMIFDQCNGFNRYTAKNIIPSILAKLFVYIVYNFCLWRVPVFLLSIGQQKRVQTIVFQFVTLNYVDLKQAFAPSKMLIDLLDEAFRVLNVQFFGDFTCFFFRLASNIFERKKRANKSHCSIRKLTTYSANGTEKSR